MKRFGWLSDADRLYQAEAFVGHCDREGRGNWMEYFEWWSGEDCKDFHPGDREGVRQIVAELMLAGGVSVLVDPLDWLIIGRDPAEVPVA